MSAEGKVVCVTGASGFIASWLVKLLLQRGYTVNATVRNTNDTKKTGHLLALDGANERLHLFKASLLEEVSFDPAVDGCVGVFHTASPAVFSSNDPQAEIIDPAVKGTLNVLKSCAKVPSIKRVIFTSSMAANMFTGKPLTSDTLLDETWFSDPLLDETWFSDPAFCQKTKSWYPLAKTLAEDAAWNFAKENGIDLVTINPGTVIGNPTIPGPYRLVDVKDIANAHIQAFELPSASGRYIMVESLRSFAEILQCLKDQFPTLHIAKLENEKLENPKYQVSRKRAESLGIEFIPWEVSLKDTIESLNEKGFLSF